MTSPLETKARALAEQIASEAVEQVEEGVEVFDRFSVPKALPFLLAFASEVERETLERAAKAQCVACRQGYPMTLRPVGPFHTRPNGTAWGICGAERIRSLSEPPAEEPKG